MNTTGMRLLRVVAMSSERQSVPSERDKIDFLSVPESYPELTNKVSVIQTHHAWVFLTDQHAYKMKKQFRHGRVDCSSLESRQYLCNEEYRLNQRLAPHTYLGVVPLAIGNDGQLCIDGSGYTVEWLVKMRRLPGEFMMNKAGPDGLVTIEDIRRLMQKLLRFHQSVPACHVGSDSYASRLWQEVSNVGEELLDPRYDFPSVLVNDVIDRLKAYIDTRANLLDCRQQQGFVREVHGDLRPEHVSLVPDAEPEIIDCLEFDPDLRCLDLVEELAYFGLECRVIDQRWIEDACIEWYQSHSGDTAPDHLWRFYAARRATVRAKLSAWHTLESDSVERWLRRGRKYLHLAQEYLDGGSVSSQS
jgi:aminoglycoside phosphotransferase family enzyme